MKCAVIAFVLLLLICHGSVNAQEQKNEFLVTAGAGSFQDVIQGIGEIAPIIVTFGLIRDETEAVTPVIGVNYKRHVSDLLSVGGTFNYQQFENTYYVLNKKVGDTDVKYYTFMGRFDLTYLRTPIFQMYSGLSAGLSAATESGTGVESDSEYWFAFHANALGMRLGKQLAAVLEIGFGYNGIFAAGLSYGF